MSSPKDHVIIIGAGVSGLALAQGLQKHGVAFSVYEREAGPDVRLQGYRIKIFPDSTEDMQYVMSESLWADFAATCAETVMVESNISAIDTHYIARRALGGPKPYTVDRSVFRRILLRGIEQHVHWGKELVGYEVASSSSSSAAATDAGADASGNSNNGNGGVKALFADGSSAVGGLLVGAEGWRSVVRKNHVPDFKIVDAEACCVYGKTPLTQDLLARVSPKLLGHLTLCRDVGTVIQQVIFDSELPVTMFCEAMRFSDEARAKYDFMPVDYVYWSMLCPSKLVGFVDAQVDAWLAKPSKELGLMLTSQWDPSVRCLLELQDERAGSSLRVATTTPDLPAWETSASVTLIGDAAHVMSTAGGVGVPTALKDAATLTKEIVAGGLKFASVQSYERKMQDYARQAIARSMRGGKKIYGQPETEKLRILKGI